MKLDEEKLRARGFEVKLFGGGAMIKSPDATEAAFVPMVGEDLQLVVLASAFHRQIYSALGGPAAPTLDTLR